MTAFIHLCSKPRRRMWALVLCAWVSAGVARADYTVALLSDGLTERTVRVGEEFNLDVQLSADALHEHWAAVFRIEFSSSGLRLVRYDWSFPYATGGEDDASVPGLAALPAVLRADLVPDGPGISNRVDVFLSNFTTAEQGYRVGRIVRLRVVVPADYAGLGAIQAQVVPESFGDGFSVIPSRAAAPFLVRISPAEGEEVASLSVSLSNGLVSVSWPGSIQGATLQTTTDLTGGWVDVGETPQLVEGRNRVQLFPPAGGPPSFFRLRFP